MGVSEVTGHSWQYHPLIPIDSKPKKKKNQRQTDLRYMFVNQRSDTNKRARAQGEKQEKHELLVVLSVNL